MEKIREKPDPNPKPVEGDIKANLERHKQVTAVQECMVPYIPAKTCYANSSIAFNTILFWPVVFLVCMH